MKTLLACAAMALVPVGLAWGLLWPLGSAGTRAASADQATLSSSARAVHWRIGSAGHRLASLAGQAPASAGRRSRRLASYRIQASLDAGRHQVTGTMRLRWHNAARTPAEHLLFHLYLNAFSNETTTWMSEAIRQRYPLSVGHGKWGGIRVHSVKVAGVAAREVRLLGDTTVLRVDPLRPVAAGDTVEVTMGFVATLPRIRARTGFEGDFHMVAQWFPKIGVRDPDGTWHCHPFYLTSEFYSDFGVYDVTLDVPWGFEVAATGRRTGTQELPGGRLRVTYRAEDVHDFAWTAGLGLRRLRRSLGGVKLQAVHFGDPLEKVRRHLEVTARSLELLQRWLGPYPYDTLTVVLVPEDASAAGGMEYPTLFTSGVRHEPLLERARALGTTVHELVHQYFYGLLASDELSEPWLDEGFTTYVTGLVLDDLFGADRSMGELGPLRLGYFQYLRLRMRRRADWDPARQRADRFAEPRSYAVNVYVRTALALRTLERKIGRRRMLGLLRDWVGRYRFAHPTGADFFRLVANHVPELLLRRFLADAINTSGVLDYEVARVLALELRRPRGVFLTAQDRRRRARAPSQGYENRVLLHRKGSLRLPVDVELRLEGGGRELVRWDGQARWHWVRLRGSRPVVAAVIDPRRDLAMDRSLLNNGLRTAADPRPARRLAGRLVVGLQTLLQLVGF